MSERTDSRARAKPQQTAERVDCIADMMRDGAWQRGQSDVMLAEEWGIAPSTVRNYSAEAWRRICGEADDAELARPTIAGTLLTNLAKADGDRKYGEVARIADVWSRVVGARAPEETKDVTPKAPALSEEIALTESVLAALRSRAGA